MASGSCELLSSSCNLLAGLLVGTPEMHDHVMSSSMLLQQELRWHQAAVGFRHQAFIC